MSDSEATPTMDIAEFRRLGFVQEINRRLLHPLGLALEVVVDLETGKEHLGGIWDYRDDPEGVMFDDVDDDFADKATNIDRLWKERQEVRRQALGWMVQPRRPEANRPAES